MSIIIKKSITDFFARKSWRMFGVISKDLNEREPKNPEMRNLFVVRPFFSMQQIGSSFSTSRTPRVPHAQTIFRNSTFFANYRHFSPLNSRFFRDIFIKQKTFFKNDILTSIIQQLKSSFKKRSIENM